MNKKSIIASASMAGAIIASIINLEGNYSNDPLDPGGETKYGITEQVARDYGYMGSMKDLPLSTANDIYTLLYITQPGFDEFISLNPALAHKLIDAGVNVGTSRVTLWLQAALNLYSRNGKDYDKIPEDGYIGKKTIKAYKDLVNKRGKATACSLIIKAIDSQQLTHYATLEKLNTYLIGWVDKRVGNIPVSQCEHYTLSLPMKVYENK